MRASTTEQRRRPRRSRFGPYHGDGICLIRGQCRAIALLPIPSRFIYTYTALTRVAFIHAAAAAAAARVERYKGGWVGGRDAVSHFPYRAEQRQRSTLIGQFISAVSQAYRAKLSAGRYLFIIYHYPHSIIKAAFPFIRHSPASSAHYTPREPSQRIFITKNALWQQLFSI